MTNYEFTFKHNESNSYVHVLSSPEHGVEFLLSKGLLDQYYFHFIPKNDGGVLIPIHDNSYLFENDELFTHIVQVLSNLSSMIYVCMYDIITNENYHLVEPNIHTRDALNLVSQLNVINDKQYLDEAEYAYAGEYSEFNGKPRTVFCTLNHLVGKYDSPDSNEGLYTYAVMFQGHKDGDIFVHDDSIFNIDLPYSLYGNLINIITVDENDRCINQEEYEKYIALSKYMAFPKLEERKPIQ